MAQPDPWMIQPRERSRYEEQFRSLRPINGIITGDQAKGFLLQSQLPPPVLGHIWGLADTDADGKMDFREFSIACKLINLKLRNFELPKTLPPALLMNASSPGVPQGAMLPPGRPSVPPMIPPLPVAPMVPPAVPPMHLPPAIPPMVPGGFPPSNNINANFMQQQQQQHQQQQQQQQQQPAAAVQLPRPPSVQSIDRVASIESPLGVASPLQEWSVPHASKLRYTQLFNSMDRTRSGYLSGPQARNVMVQSQVAQQVLAQIWALADMDSDGRLSCEEFVLALHLCELAKQGEKIPVVLPPDLIPPTFRRQRQGSLTAASNTDIGDMMDKEAALNLLTTTFEDKRKENFDKGQAELERRRKTLLEIQRKEQEERIRKEKEEEEKRERVRLDQERRRQAEFEKQLQRQREAEQQQEEQRKRANEQRESARREMERQRQLEWEKSRSQELQQTRQREQEKVLKLKAKNQTLGIELSQLNDKVKELSGKISETRLGVSGVKTTIDGMRTTRDTQLADMSSLKTRLKEQNQRLVSLSQEKNRLEAKNKANLTQDSLNQEQVQVTFSNKQITLKQLRDRLTDLQKEIEVKLEDIENNNSQLGDLKQQLGSLVQECQQLYTVYEGKRSKVLELKGQNARRDPTDYGSSWGAEPAEAWAATQDADWPTEEPTANQKTDNTPPGFSKFRALYEFVARNGDEISFQPGDIIMVPATHNAEPGWLAGEIRGHTGWFPESYVEPVDSPTTTGAVTLEPDAFGDAVEFPPDVVSAEQAKRQLEEIAEVPENVSDTGSLAEMANVTGAQLVNEIVKQAESTLAASGESGYYVALYPYASPESGDLNFDASEVILVIKKEGDWWTGVVGNRQGIFPANYVQPAAIESEEALTEKQASPENVKSVAEPPAVLKTPPVAQQAPSVAQQAPPVAQQTPPVAQQISPAQQAPPVAQQTATAQAEEPPAVKSPATPDFAAMNASTMGKSRKPEIATVIAPYQATSTEQLSLSRGQLIMIRKKTTTGWWEGELQAKGRKRQVGWFPASYVKLLSSGRNTPVMFEETNKPDLPEFSAPQSNQEKVVALFPYAALNSDELSFDKDDVIILLAREEEAWWRGELNGVSGLFPSNYVAAMSSVRMTITERKRQEHIKELIETEEAYIEDMLIVHDVFEKRLLESKVVTREEVSRIFVNWRDIIVCNHTFLRALRVRREMSAGGVIRMIGDILCENLPRMTSYVRFCSCQLSAATFLQQLTERSAEFREVQRTSQGDPRTKGMPLSSFLIKPMQRITKYPLLIKKVLELTPETHPDRQNLLEALAKAEEFCTQVNEGVRETENSERLEWLQQHVNCDSLPEQITFNSVTNSVGPRKFLHHGILRKTKSGKELVGFLLNDFLLLTQPTKPLPPSHSFTFDSRSTTMCKTYKKPLLLNQLTVLNDGAQGAESSPDVQLRLFDSAAKMTLNLVAPSTTERSLWVKRLDSATRDLLEHEKCRIQRQQSKQAQFGACGRVLVLVSEGVDLKPIAGKCDAFCEVSMGSQRHRTTVVQGTTSPQWNSSMQFLVKDVQEDVLCVTVFDHGHFTPNGFLGRTEVRIADVFVESRDSRVPIMKHLLLHEVEAGEIRIKLDLRLFNK